MQMFVYTFDLTVHRLLLPFEVVTIVILRMLHYGHVCMFRFLFFFYRRRGCDLEYFITS